MKLVCLFLISLGLGFSTYGQKTYADSVMTTLCSDFFAGRGYVENGADKGASYIISELKRNEILPFPGRSYAQNYSFDVNTFPNPISVALDKEELTIGADYLVDPNSGTSVGTYRVFNVKLSTYESDLKAIKKDQTPNKILVFDSEACQGRDTLYRFKKLAMANTKKYQTVLLSKHKLMYSVGRFEMKHAMVTIQDSVYHACETITLNVKNRFKTDYPSKNVIGYIPGKRKKKFIVITGHYDHLGKMGQAIFPGANDNASGTAMLLSLGRYFKTHPPKYSIVLIFFSGEEAGLEGSKYFVRHPFFGLKSVKFLLNIDILGSASQGITAVNGTVHKKHFKLLQKLNSKYQYLPTVKRRGPTQNSDHYYFSQTGVPSFFVYSMGDVKNYHDIYDTAENTPLHNFDKVMHLFTRFLEKL